METAILDIRRGGIQYGQSGIAPTAPGGTLDPDEADGPWRPRRHPLQVAGTQQSRWRCEVHRWRENHIVVLLGGTRVTRDAENRNSWNDLNGNVGAGSIPINPHQSPLLA